MVSIENENKKVEPGAASNFLHKVLDVRFLTKNTYNLRIERNNLIFKAGQLINVGIPGVGVNREYSIYSGLNENFIDILIREVEGGVVSVALKNSKPGDFVEVHGPYGEFWLTNAVESRSYLFIATGTGIAPFHCFVKSYPHLKYKVLQGVRFLNECYDKSDYKPGQYVGCVSKEQGGDFFGRVTDYLKVNKVSPETITYLCGNRSMIIEVYGILRGQGVPSSNIFTEVFF